MSQARQATVTQAKRQPLSKTARFEVFKRDGFRCQYCGQCPPAVVLEIDHVVALKRGGQDSPDNLITACFDCNRGKGVRDLQVAPETVAEKAEQIKERRRQLRAFERLLTKEREELDKAVLRVQTAIFPEGGWEFADPFKESVRSFLRQLTLFDVLTFAELSAAKVEDHERRIKYFCGCCWRKIRGDDRAGRWRNPE